MSEVNQQENQAKVAKTESEQNSGLTGSDGLHLMGYVVPWWVVVAVLLLIVWLLHCEGYFGKHEKRTVGLVGGGNLFKSIEDYGLETPTQMRQILSGF